MTESCTVSMSRAQEVAAGFQPRAFPVLAARQFGSGGVVEANAVHVGRDGLVAAAGSFTEFVDFGGGALVSAGESDGFVVVLDSAGSELWSRRFGGPAADDWNDLALDGMDAAIFATSFDAPEIDLGAAAPVPLIGLRDAILVKYGRAGSLEWVQHVGAINADVSVVSVAADPSGNAVVAGALNGTVDFGGGPVVGARQAGPR